MKIPGNFTPGQLIFIFTCALLFLIEVEYFMWVGLIYLACHFLGLQFTWGGATIMAIIGVVLVNLFRGKSNEESNEDPDDGQDNGSDN